MEIAAIAVGSIAGGVILGCILLLFLTRSSVSVPSNASASNIGRAYVMEMHPEANRGNVSLIGLPPNRRGEQGIVSSSGGDEVLVVVPLAKQQIVGRRSIRGKEDPNSRDMINNINSALSNLLPANQHKRQSSPQVGSNPNSNTYAERPFSSSSSSVPVVLLKSKRARNSSRKARKERRQ